MVQGDWSFGSLSKRGWDRKPNRKPGHSWYHTLDQGVTGKTPLHVLNLQVVETDCTAEDRGNPWELEGVS